MKINKLLAHLSVCAAALMAGSSAHAIATMPSTGTCGFTLGYSAPFIGAQLIDANSSASGPLNWIGTLTFTSATAGTFLINKVEQTAVASASSPSFTNTQSTTSGSFTVAAGPIANSSTITLSGSLALNAIATNSGNTILLQRFSSSSAWGSVGVCQF